MSEEFADNVPEVTPAVVTDHGSAPSAEGSTTDVQAAAASLDEVPPSADDTAAAGGEAVAVIAPGHANGQVVAAIISAPASVAGDGGLPAPYAPEGSAIPLSVISAAEVAPRAYVPRPRPAIVPERCDAGWRTAGVLVERVAAGYYITVQQPPPRGPNRIYVTPAAFDKLVALATGPVFDVGRLWKALADIPLERPLPNRLLEEELKLLLSAYANEIRRR